MLGLEVLLKGLEIDILKPRWFMINVMVVKMQGFAICVMDSLTKRVRKIFYTSVSWQKLSMISMRKNKMRILQVFEKVGHGGTEKMISNLSRGLLSLGHETCLWTKQIGEEIPCINSITSKDCPWSYEPDVILVHGGFLGTSYYFGSKDHHKVPVVEILHRNLEVDGKADFYVSPNIYGIKINPGLSNLQHIDNPVAFDVSPIDKERERKRYRIKKDDFVIVRHARLGTDKGWPRFMWVIDRVLSKNENVICVICGDGDEKVTEMIGRWAKGKRCIVRGWEKDTDTLLKIADLYLETSSSEAFGMSAVEAAACRLPVVSFNVPGINEIFGKSRYCVQDNDLFSCVERIQELINNREKRLQEGKRNFEMVYSRYDIRNVASSYVQCLEKVCELKDFGKNFIKDNDNPVHFHEMLKNSFCKKFGVSNCIRIYWLLIEWNYRMHAYGVNENVLYIMQSIKPIYEKKLGINQINLAVEFIASYASESCCLNKAVVKGILLRENGYDAILVFGVLKNQNKLDGHSWIEMKSGEILDCKDAYKSCNIVMKKNLFHE